MDECEENKEVCSETEICINEEGGYRCVPKSESTEKVEETTPKSTVPVDVSSSKTIPPVVCAPGFEYFALRNTCVGKYY